MHSSEAQLLPQFLRKIKFLREDSPKLYNLVTKYFTSITSEDILKYNLTQNLSNLIKLIDEKDKNSLYRTLLFLINKLNSSKNVIEKTINFQKRTKRLKFLEHRFKILQREINIVRTREMDMTDLENENSAYLQEDKLQRKALAVWRRIRRLQGRSFSCGRIIGEKIVFKESEYPEINAAIERYINSRSDYFPDYMDIYELVVKVNLKKDLKIAESSYPVVAKSIFQSLGKILKDRRSRDFNADFLANVPSTSKDAILSDLPEGDKNSLFKLEPELERNFVNAQEKFKYILDDFVRRENDIKSGSIIIQCEDSSDEYPDASSGEHQIDIVDISCDNSDANITQSMSKSNCLAKTNLATTDLVSQRDITKIFPYYNDKKRVNNSLKGCVTACNKLALELINTLRSSNSMTHFVQTISDENANSIQSIPHEVESKLAHDTNTNVSEKEKNDEPKQPIIECVYDESREAVLRKLNPSEYSQKSAQNIHKRFKSSEHELINLFDNNEESETSEANIQQPLVESNIIPNTECLETSNNSESNTLAQIDSQQPFKDPIDITTENGQMPPTERMLPNGRDCLVSDEELSESLSESSNEESESESDDSTPEVITLSD